EIHVAVGRDGQRGRGLDVGRLQDRLDLEAVRHARQWLLRPGGGGEDRGGGEGDGEAAGDRAGALAGGGGGWVEGTPAGGGGPGGVCQAGVAAFRRRRTEFIPFEPREE